MTPTKLAVVVVGQFNPAILVPEWVSKQGLLPPTEVPGPTNLLMGGPAGFSVRHSMAGMRWVATADRLLVEAEDGEGDGDARTAEIATFVRKVLERLPHTPIAAVGMNFVFDLSSTDSLIFALRRRSVTEVAEDLGRALALSSLKLVLTIDDGQVQVEMVNSAPAVGAISFNFHRPVNGSAAASDALGKALGDLAWARTTVAFLLKDTA